jgi:kinesin family protein 6/9
LHLVDLSGSERIKQTGVEGLLEREARSINLSLHYLERVIVSLNKSNNATGEHVHIPYRDSLMTMVLKDSIGGNCKTRMIATMSPRTQDIAEGIATCKFAQRVAMIKNQIERNERVDPGVIIQRLKQENAQLKAELALLKGGDVKDELDKY